jgi:TonB-dependent SusC/RagA subfamily outer membrane receptor
MRKLIVVFFLLISVSAFAQTKDTVATRHILKINLSDTSMHLEKLYIILNGNEYKGTIDSINADKITSVTTMNPAQAQKIYGVKAANGALILTTWIGIRDPARLPLYRDPIYVVDDVITKFDLNTTNAESILKVEVLKDAKATAVYGSSGANGVIIITTKQFAIRQYQKKLSAISEAYKKYLAAHKNDDSGLSYVIDGEVVKPGNKFIDTLFNLPSFKIQQVNMLGPKEFEGMTTHLVIITTKK